MARPKSAAPAGQLFSIRGRLEWAHWVEGLRRHCDRPSVAALIETALAAEAARVKFRPPPPRKFRPPPLRPHRAPADLVE